MLIPSRFRVDAWRACGGVPRWLKRFSAAVAMLGAAFLGAAGCASIPSEAPQLSSELGERLQSLENAHLALVHRYMDERRARVSEFVDSQWTPLFAEEFFSDPEMLGAWEEVVQGGSAADRTRYILAIAPVLIEEIEAKRREMLQPLDEIERELTEGLRNEYLQAKAVNNALTAFLASASQVDQTRREYLGMAGVDEDRLRASIREADEAVDDLVVRKRQAEEAVAAAQDYLEKMKRILDELRDPSSAGGAQAPAGGEQEARP